MKTVCIDCGKPQFNTPSGISCANGHGGAPGMSPESYQAMQSSNLLAISGMHAVRNAGHPWDQRAGFDHLYINAPDQATMNAAIAKAKEKHWQIWLNGINEPTGLPACVMYKPSGIQEPWDDHPDKPYVPGS